MYPVPVSIILGLGLAAFAYTAYRRGFILLRAPASKRFNHFGRRVAGVLEYACGQERLLFKDFKSGIFHAFIFWGVLRGGDSDHRPLRHGARPPLLHPWI